VAYRNDNRLVCRQIKGREGQGLPIVSADGIDIPHPTDYPRPIAMPPPAAEAVGYKRKAKAKTGPAVFPWVAQAAFRKTAKSSSPSE
jgi:hypothetical protein